MSGRRTLLIEIGCEEIPARMLPGAGRDLAALVAGLLDRAGLAHDEPRPLWTPRRLAVLVERTETETAPMSATVTGPPERAAWDADGKPTRAAEGFARRHGLAVDALRAVATDKGRYAAVTVETPARGIGEVLAGTFGDAVARMSFPKMMRWGTGEYSFVRPVHWLVALADDELLPITLFGVRAGRLSRGHRLAWPGPVELTDARAYVERLAEAGVEVRPDARRTRLADALAASASEADGSLVRDESLLDEVSDMVEYPGACAGWFDARYVSDLPREVLGTCLRHHQRAFMVERDGVTKPSFVVAVNVEQDPEGHVRRGNEWVVSGRLDDALFFWTEDCRRRLDARAEELRGVTFQRDLGSYAAKTRRVEQLCAWLAATCRLDTPGAAALARAALLARCDLVTGLVGEFPELQGVAGGLLARADGEDARVAAAIYDLYKPAGADDPLPSEREARLLGLADRVDTLTGTFAIGLLPTGSRDPFGLRRLAAAAVRLAGSEPDLDLIAVVSQALDILARGPDAPTMAEEPSSVTARLGAFLFERFAVQAAEKGARYDEIAAIREAAQREFRAADLAGRLEALSGFRRSGDFLALAAAAKRVRNLLAQAAERGEPVEPGQAEQALQHPAEQGLAGAVERAELVATSAGTGEHARVLEAIASLRPEVDRFFDEVLVMDEDVARRRARIGLLARIDALARTVADMSEIVVEGAEAST